MIWDNFCFDASIEKFHSSSQEGGGCHHHSMVDLWMSSHFLMNLWMTLTKKCWRIRFLWSVESFEKFFGCHLSTKNLKLCGFNSVYSQRMTVFSESIQN